MHPEERHCFDLGIKSMARNTELPTTLDVELRTVLTHIANWRTL